MFPLYIFLIYLGSLFLHEKTAMSVTDNSKTAEVSADPDVDIIIADLPDMSEAVKSEGFESGASSLVNIWEHGLRLQRKEKIGENTTPKPATLIASSSALMSNLVPQDTGHPLYAAGPVYTGMRHAFLRDSMIEQKVLPDDEKLKSAEGLTVVNMNGREMNFKQKEDGKLYMNDIVVSSHKLLSDGTQLYVLEDIIFSYEKEVREAWEKLMSGNKGGECPFGPCF